jgi:hypothetical protein
MATTEGLTKATTSAMLGNTGDTLSEVGTEYPASAMLRPPSLRMLASPELFVPYANPQDIHIVSSRIMTKEIVKLTMFIFFIWFPLQHPENAR